MNNFDKKLINLMAAVFKVKPSKIDKNITNRDIESWDSLRQINLVSAIEVEFKVEISIEEASEMLSYIFANRMLVDQAP